MRYKFFFILFLLFSSCVSNPVPYPARRWQIDRDKDLIAQPKTNEQFKYSDIGEKYFFNPIERALDLGRHVQNQALNLNNFDEVPDSTWFTNRIGQKNLELTEIARGPDRLRPFIIHAPWTIKKAKTQGVTPGFFIRDARGVNYLLKFEPSGYAELPSSVEVITTKIFHAIGYNVPENYIVEIDPKILKIDPKARYKDRIGREQKFTEAQVQEIFSKVEKNARGKYRVLVSRYLEGIPLGPFKFSGTRLDDANDRIPHEHRRELRGYRIFAAWLNHYDSREANTLDMFISRENKRGYVKHYLIDFGSTLGSRGNTRQTSSHLYAYPFNLFEILASFVSLGSYQEKVRGSETPHHLALGNIEWKDFEVEAWRPIYPNPAFQNMTDADAFWALKILSRFDEAVLRTIIGEAQYSRKIYADLMLKILLERRNHILDHYFAKMSPLSDFEFTVENGKYKIRARDLSRFSHRENFFVSKVRLKRRGRKSFMQTLDVNNEKNDKISFYLPSELFKDSNSQNIEISIEAYLDYRRNYRKAISLFFRYSEGRLQWVGLRHR